MDAVCIWGGMWVVEVTGDPCAQLDAGDVFRVSAVRIEPMRTRTFWQHHFGKKYVWLHFETFPTRGFDARGFRPAQRNNRKIIERIKACRHALKQVEV